MGTGARAVVANLPAAPGVYRFRDERGRVLYIGRATHLRQRVGSYWSDLRDRRHLRAMVPRIVHIEAVACDSVHEAAWLERNLLERSKPRWNRVPGGAEVPVYLGLDRRKTKLSVLHEPQAGVDVFGPYLGGTKARLAASALDRVLPLGCTDHRISGFQLDLARVRGVAVADRAVFLATTAAVLNREPAALALVRDRLTRQRERASASLAFEFAARVQQEIEAVEWLVAEQKVTVPANPDCDVHGWSDDLLIRFEVRGGRLNGWLQRACPRPAAQRYLDRTPAGWRPFADRSAELARRLLPPTHR